MNNKLEDENEGQAIEELKGNYTEIKGDLEGCHEEVDDLYTIFDGYISEMQDIIRPIDPNSIMQVDRNDIWWNMQSIFGACVGVECLKINVGTYMSLPNFFKSDEEKANEDSNERKIEEIWDDINRCAELLNTNMSDLQNKYDNKIIPYENKDDEYASKAGGLYSKYTSAWEYVKEKTKESIIDTVDTVKGLLKSVADLVVGAFGLIKGLAIYAAAGVAIDIKEVTGEVPDWMQYCIDKSDEYNNTILEVLKDPGLIIEGLSQSVSDTYEEKGIAYASGYIAGEVVQTILISKGIDKLKGISKVGEVADGGSGLVDDTVKHAVGSANQAQSVLDGIDPQYFNKKSRFGGGFYVGADSDTIVAELAEHGNEAKYAISYDVNLNGQKILDLTNPDVASEWGFVQDLTSTKACQKIGDLAKTQGYSTIKFQSYRGSGVNYVLYNNFEDILTPTIVTPVE